MAEARAETAKLIEQGKKKLEAERQAVRAELSTKAAGIARDVASRILGRELAS